MDLNAEPAFLVGKGSVNSSFSEIQPCLPEHFNDIHETRYSRDREQDKVDLPDRFGIVLDGWSKGSTHYIYNSCIRGIRKRRGFEDALIGNCSST
jgi:hypothetical protein